MIAEGGRFDVPNEQITVKTCRSEEPRTRVERDMSDGTGVDVRKSPVFGVAGHSQKEAVGKQVGIGWSLRSLR